MLECLVSISDEDHYIKKQKGCFTEGQMKKQWLSLFVMFITGCFQLTCSLPVERVQILSTPTQAIGVNATIIPEATSTSKVDPTFEGTIGTQEMELSSQLVRPEDFEYMGAFRLPQGGERPRTFEYGGSAMTFNPDGDTGGAQDGFPGSLYISGHDRLPYGELQDGNQISEVNIPAPVISKDLDALSRAEFLQDFANVSQGFFTGLDEIPRLGMLYFNHPLTGAKIHLTWGQHLQPEDPVASQAWFNPDLKFPDMQGTWFIGDQSLYSVTGYLFEIPAVWADQYAQGKYLATGRFRDGGWSGMGPVLFAYRPWDENGQPVQSGTRLSETVLLQYSDSLTTENFAQALQNYQHPDEWEGGAWLTTLSGKSAVVFVGTKSIGTKYWYGFTNPAGADNPCVEGEMIGQFPLCRLADGNPCPETDLVECENHNDYRGWWSTAWEARFILYDPDDLAKVVTGELKPWEPQPYAWLTVDQNLLLNPLKVEEDMIGRGVQRRFRIGEAAYDRANSLLYVLELYADGAAPVVHVWGIK
jgi:hypothetical protein